jgi:UDP-2,3-diacylglucosamine hydrolase
MQPAAPRSSAQSVTMTWPVLEAPSAWRHIDFISDLHLQASEPATWAAWQQYMHSTKADALFILGDLFEVWVGDDVLNPSPDSATNSSEGFESNCAAVLLAASARMPVFFMRGNRDFLVGSDLAKCAGLTLLDDPTVLSFAGQRWLLSHGDALCLQDVDYMKFRAQVRSPEWQQVFLARPLAERQALARELRSQSEQRKSLSTTYIDLDAQACTDWLMCAQSKTLIHGHTHQPAEHALGNGLQRIVLSDWDLDALPARAEVLRLSTDPHTSKCSLNRLPLAQAA